MQIKDAIRFYRKKAGLTQLQLAEQLKVNRSTIARYENGSNHPSPKMVEDISEIVGFDLMQYYRNEYAGDPPFVRSSKSALETFVECIAKERGYSICDVLDTSDIDDIGNMTSDMNDPDGKTYFHDNSSFQDGFEGARLYVDIQSINDGFGIAVPNKELIEFWDRVIQHAGIEFDNIIDTRNGEQD